MTLTLGMTLVTLAQVPHIKRDNLTMPWILEANYIVTTTKFAKVMFSQVSVCPQGRGCMLHCMQRYRHPFLGKTLPWTDTHVVYNVHFKLFLSTE